MNRREERGMTLLDYANELGLPMGTLWNGTRYGWTTDKAKAETMRGHAAVRVENVPSLDPRPEARRFDGYEISFPATAEVASS